MNFPLQRKNPFIPLTDFIPEKRKKVTPFEEDFILDDKENVDKFIFINLSNGYDDNQKKGCFTSISSVKDNDNPFSGINNANKANESVYMTPGWKKSSDKIAAILNIFYSNHQDESSSESLSNVSKDKLINKDDECFGKFEEQDRKNSIAKVNEISILSGGSQVLGDCFQTPKKDQKEDKPVIDGKNYLELENKYKELEERFMKRERELVKQLESNNLERKNLHSFLQKLRGNIRVFCRIKSESPVEVAFRSIQTNVKDSIEALELKQKPNLNNQSNTFFFDKIFHNNSQIEVFNEILPFLKSAVDGDNVAIFAYGPTGTGKTYTMQGENSAEGKGILPRISEFILEESHKIKVLGNTMCIEMCAFEVYNERIYDLLSQDRKPELKLLVANQVTVQNLSWKKIESCQEIPSLLIQASQARSSGSTIYNDKSSRSHAIFQIKLTRIESNLKKESYITVVDLAGSERGSNSLSVNEKSDEKKKLFTESTYINKSLTTLGRVINMISDKKDLMTHVPYRDSKLTLVLSPMLNKNAKTAIIITISQDMKNYSLTKETLGFARQVMCN